MSLATDLQDDIAELLDDDDIGRSITIGRKVPGTYDPATGSTGTDGTPLSFTTRALFLNYDDRLINGSTIRRGDRKCYIKVKDSRYVPIEGDQVTAGADILNVVQFKPIELGGTAIIYIMQVRQ